MNGTRFLTSRFWSREHNHILTRLLGIVSIPLGIKIAQVFRSFGLSFDNVATHQSPSLFGKETDDLKIAILLVLKYWRNDTCI